MTRWPLDWRALVDEAKRRRTQEGLSQRSLAALAGVSVPTVNAFERGEINLRFERIVAILDALGLFVQAGRNDSLQEFVLAAHGRWRELVAELPADHPSRQPHGYSEQAYRLTDVAAPPPLARLREALARAPKTSGWPPFWVPTRETLKPVIRDGLIECWLGRPGSDRMFADAAHSDFWQVTRDGAGFLQRGFQEDGSDFEPGTIFDLTLPIWRNAELLTHAAWLARELGGDADSRLRFSVRYSGLAGRELLAWAKPLLRFGLDSRPRARTDAVELGIDLTVGAIEDGLETALATLLAPLYERFDGYVASGDLIAGQLADFRRWLADADR